MYLFIVGRNKESLNARDSNSLGRDKESLKARNSNSLKSRDSNSLKRTLSPDAAGRVL